MTIYQHSKHENETTLQQRKYFSFGNHTQQKKQVQIQSVSSQQYKFEWFLSIIIKNLMGELNKKHALDKHRFPSI